jgi:hypothetical protein
LAATHTLVWLNKPYTTQAMQAALDKVVASVRPKVVELSVIAPVPRLTSVPIPTPVVAEHPSGLSVGDLQLRLEAPEHLGRHGFLRKLSDLLIQGQPFEARFTVQNSLIVHPEHGWVATNTPMMVIERVCKSDSLASAVDVRPIDSEQAEERLGRLRMTPVELEVFLLALATSTFNS